MKEHNKKKNLIRNKQNKPLTANNSTDVLTLEEWTAYFILSTYNIFFY